MIRTFALLIFVSVLSTATAQAGEEPGFPDKVCEMGDKCSPPIKDPGFPDKGCQPGDKCEFPKDGPVEEPNHPSPKDGFCDGTYEGYYYGEPNPVTFQIEKSGKWGQISVTSWWRGGMWYGQGVCRQVSHWQAAFELYFPGAPVHRGVVNSNRHHAVMEGQIDGSFPFRLSRKH